MIGHYEMLFQKKSKFIYRTSASHNGCKAYFIRRMNWYQIVEEASYAKFVMDHFLKVMLADYVNKIYNPITDYQDKALSIYKE